MSEHYNELNQKCKEISEQVISENSVLGDKFLSVEERNFLLSDWNAFLIALIADQSVKVEVAWRLPYYFAQRLGHFDFEKILKEESIDSLEQIIKEKPALHRYPRKMAEYIWSAVEGTQKEYDGNIANLWLKNPDVCCVIEKFEKFKGISHKKAALGSLLLVRDFGVPLINLNFIDITYDLHVRRVFLRMGLVQNDDFGEVTSVARLICEPFPGSLTLPFWVVGRDFCRPSEPNCDECYLRKFCEKKTCLGKTL